MRVYLPAASAGRTSVWLKYQAVALCGLFGVVAAQVFSLAGPFPALKERVWALAAPALDLPAASQNDSAIAPVVAAVETAPIAPRAIAAPAAPAPAALAPVVTAPGPALVAAVEPAADPETTSAVEEQAAEAPASYSLASAESHLVTPETRPVVMVAAIETSVAPTEDESAQDSMDFGSRWSITIPYWEKRTTIVVPQQATRLAPPVVTTPRQAMRPEGVMAVVDRYLWEVYQRVPTKRDGSGDFTWKDPAAAQKRGVSLENYVVGGMDPDFREQLYHAGHAMDSAGLNWSMLSAFRDDYRQSLAAGFKAHGGNSLHGGSTATGGYGHGRAIDITASGGDNDASAVWHWIDAHGRNYGLTRPMPGYDPAHIQPARGSDWHVVGQRLRDARMKQQGGGTDTTASVEPSGKPTKVAARGNRGN